MNKERAAAYLGQGVPPSQVASIMGCTPAYISQLVKDEDFMLLVEKHRSMVDGSAEAEETSLVAKATGLQHQIMKAIGESLTGAELPALTKALDTLSQVHDRIAQRKNPANRGTDSGRVAVHVSLTLPAHAIQNVAPVIELNEKNEVVSIDHKPMAPMASNGVEKMFREKKALASIVKEI